MSNRRAKAKAPAASEPDWGIPNWRDETAYLSATDEPGLFAWEFLRRNHDYRKAWSDWRELSTRCGFGPDDYGPDGKKDVTTETSTDCFDLNPPAQPGETFHDYENRIGDGVRYRASLKVYRLAEEWRIRFNDLPDPHRPGWARTHGRFTVYGNFLFFSTGLVPRHAGHGDKVRQPKANEVAITFDLTSNINDQLDRARIVLAAEQKRKRIRNPRAPTMQPKLFPLYLRILDASRAGVRLTEIARELFPNDENHKDDGYPVSDRIKKMLGKAEGLVDGGWQDILNLKMSTSGRRTGKKR